MLLLAVRGVRRARALATLASIAAACAGATAVPAFAAPSVPPLGYFQSRNVRWGIPPKVLEQVAQKTEAMHFGPGTHAPDQNHMSATFFPVTGLQIAGLNALGFDFYLTPGSSCAGGSPRVVLVVDDPANPSPAGQEKQIHVYPADASACSPGAWRRLDLLAGGRWNAAQLGGGSSLSRTQAHEVVRAQLGDAYKVTRVRINFDGGAGPDAWFDNFTVNKNALADRTMDTTPEAWQPEAGALPVAAPTAGYFLVRTAKWAPRPQLLANALQWDRKNEALHYSPSSRSENADFMSTSFFPQSTLTLDGLKRLDFDILIQSGSCGPNAPRVVAVLQAASKGSQTLQVQAEHPGCVTGAWKTLNFLDAGVAWSVPARGVHGSTFAAARQAARAWAADATIQVLRVTYLGNDADVWVDNHHVNEMTLAERVQDFSAPSQLPSPGVRGDGFVAHIDFPGNSSAITADGTVVLTADASRRIRVRVRPYFDADRDGSYNPDPAYHVSTYPSVLNVAFFDHAGQAHLYVGRDTGLAHTGNGFYEGTLTLPAGFPGGAYLVTVNDNNADGVSGADNRASYFFLPKELMLRNGDAGMAPFADLLDTPSTLLAPTVAWPAPLGVERGYEGPRSPVIIAPVN